MKFDCVLIFLITVGCALAQEPGKLAPAITCATPARCSYAVYVPSTYDPVVPSPALFMFDPLARGVVAAGVARDAAEKHGVMVFASNDSKNGPLRASYEAATAMWNDAHQRFKIDPQRTYAAGFSGGARFATVFAKVCGTCISLVIANGAGLAPALPPKDVSYDIFFTIGETDFNYSEVINLRTSLLKLKVPTRVFVFHGGHEWSPNEGWQQAFDWIELREMKRGVRKTEVAELKRIQQSFNDYAAMARKEFGLAEGFRAEESAALDFVWTDRMRLPVPVPSREAAKALEAEQSSFKRAMASATEFARQIDLISMPATIKPPSLRTDDGTRAEDDGDARAQALRDLRSRMSALWQRVDNGGPTAIQDRRELGYMIAGSFEAAESAMQKKEYEPALDLYSAVVDFAKSAPGAHLGKARALAALKKNNDALAEAKLALQTGVGAEELKSVPEFANLIDRPEWQALLTK